MKKTSKEVEEKFEVCPSIIKQGMKSNELRIGNLVTSGRHVFEIREVHSDSYIRVKSETTNDNQADPSRLAGILLSEHVLKSCGFIPDPEKCGVMRHPDADHPELSFYNLEFLAMPSRCGLDWTAYPVCRESRKLIGRGAAYLHDLQNLFFHMIGGELAIDKTAIR